MKYDFWEFKQELWGDEWQSYNRNAYDHHDVAEKLAEDDYNEEPTDPSNYEYVVEVRKNGGDPVKIKVFAEASVSFHSNELED